jgi:HSP20 family protein
MRYRRLSHHEATVVRAGRQWPFDDIWPSEHFRVLVHPRWRPAADAYETASTIEILVDLAGVGEDDFEVRLFDDALVVEGHRRLPVSPEGAVYHAAGIRQGPFQLELPLPVAVDPERVTARCDLGLLRITLPKRAGAR